jgi:hypothetical protein
MSTEIEDRCICELDAFLEQWDKEGIPTHEQIYALMMAGSCYAMGQDNPYEALTAMINCLMGNFYALKTID